MVGGAENKTRGPGLFSAVRRGGSTHGAQRYTCREGFLYLKSVFFYVCFLFFFFFLADNFAKYKKNVVVCVTTRCSIFSKKSNFFFYRKEIVHRYLVSLRTLTVKYVT